MILLFDRAFCDSESCCPRLNIASHCYAACDTLRAVFATTRDILSKERLIERRV